MGSKRQWRNCTDLLERLSSTKYYAEDGIDAPARPFDVDKTPDVVVNKLSEFADVVANKLLGFVGKLVGHLAGGCSRLAVVVVAWWTERTASASRSFLCSSWTDGRCIALKQMHLPGPWR